MTTLFQEMTINYNAEYKSDPGIGQQPIRKYIPDSLKQSIEEMWGDSSDKAALIDIFMRGYVQLCAIASLPRAYTPLSGI